MELVNESLVLKEYPTNMTLRNARTKFRMRSHMLDVKLNKKSDKKNTESLWKCDFCTSLDSQSHITWCPAFSTLRDGRNLKNDSDVIDYVQQVMKIRTQ